MLFKTAAEGQGLDRFLFESKKYVECAFDDISALVFGLVPPASSQNIENARLNPKIQEAESSTRLGL